MLVGVVVFMAVVLQSAAAVLAIRAWRFALRSPAWLIIAAVAVLMVVRRLISLHRVVIRHDLQSVDLSYECVGLAVSLMMVVGIVWARSLLGSVLASRDELRRRTEELDHRIRELNCLYALADLINRPGISLDEIVEGTVGLLPAACRFPCVACVRVSLDGHEHQSDNFAEARWRRSEAIVVQQKPRGVVEVGYLQRCWPENEEPFIREENRLLTAVAERIGRIVERFQAQEQLGRHREELARVSRLSTMGEMASSLAHELNQPLAAIANYVGGCQRRLRSGVWNQEELLVAMEETAVQAGRAGQIVRNLRDFVAKGEMDRTRVDVNRVVEAAVDLMAGEATVRGVLVRVEAGQGLPAVLADAIQIEQVIVNVLRNALEAMSDASCERREVEIRTRSHAPDMVEVGVRDSGPGLPPDAGSQVFEAFFTTKPEGMGMGLSISRSIIEAHRGRLWVTPNEDRGVTFHFTLPASRGEGEHA